MPYILMNVNTTGIYLVATLDDISKANLAKEILKTVYPPETPRNEMDESFIRYSVDNAEKIINDKLICSKDQHIVEDILIEDDYYYLINLN